ncbi:MAG: protein kinase domain-containing protein [Streptosporangiaceae bacterium]
MKPLAADDPRVIGEYRLRAQLGAGGMGRVYLGLSPAGRAVAIKVVHSDLASDADFLRRFGQEVAAARAVSGIYTAPVVASGLNERPPWLATAFVPGPPLDQVVAENGPLPEQALRPLLAGLVEALQAIHACGVVHRDLKPANVLLATDGPRVIDFGIARAADGTSLTAAGVVFGTPGYMSPEQAEGRGAGPASDVFALGCVVAYAAAGMGPFGTGTAAAILYRVVHAQPVLDGVPPRFRPVIAACLAKDPAARPSLRALSGMIAGGMDATGPSAVAFWPSSVARLIGAHQARLEEQTRSRPAEGFSWATTMHRPTTPWDPGRDRPPGPQSPGPQSPEPQAPAPQSPGPQSPGPQSPGPQSPRPRPPEPQAPAPRWPYSGPGGAQASLESQAVGVQYPEPRGYLSGNGVPVAQPAGYPQPHRTGSPGATVPLPASMVTAVRLMYAGAAFALIWAIGVIAVSASIVKHYPQASESGDHRLAGAVTLAILLCAADIALWLAIARACRRGSSGARVAGTVLFAVHTVGVLGVATSSQAGLGPAKVLTLIGWLIGLGAVVALWQPPSSAFFTAQASLNR